MPETSQPLLCNLDLEISNPCNERCVHCYRTCEKTRSGFLSFFDVQKILSEAQTFMSEDAKILLTGGEVLLNKEWKEIVLAASKITNGTKRRFSIFTNGSLMTKSDADFIAGFVGKGLSTVQISLYAMDEKIHDEVTGLSGSCKKTKEAILLLKSRGVPIFVSCPAMQKNKNDFFRVMSWCDKNEIPSCADLMIFGNSDYENSNAKERLCQKDLEDFFEISMKENAALAYVWGKSRPKNLKKEKFYASAANGICVSGDGSVYPMIGWYEKIGSIREKTLKEIFYESPLLNEARKYSVADFSECVNCTASDFCTFCPNPHLTANGGTLGKLDKNFCRFVHLVKSFAQRRDEILGKR